MGFCCCCFWRRRGGGGGVVCVCVCVRERERACVRACLCACGMRACVRACVCVLSKQEAKVTCSCTPLRYLLHPTFPSKPPGSGGQRDLLFHPATPTFPSLSIHPATPTFPSLWIHRLPQTTRLRQIIPPLAVVHVGRVRCRYWKHSNNPARFKSVSPQNDVEIGH